MFVTVLAFYGRNFVVTYLANHYLAEYDSSLDCVDFTIDADFNMVIYSLCISSPIADVEVLDSQVHWQLDPLQSLNTSILELVSGIQINHLNIQARPQTALVTSDNEKPLQQGSSFNFNNLPSVLRNHTNELLNSWPMMTVDIEQIHYQPIDHTKQQNTDLYQGKFSLSENNLAINLIDDTDTEILSLLVDRTSKETDIVIVLQLAEIQHLVEQHRLLFKEEFTYLGRQKLGNLSGAVRSKWTVNDQAIVIDNQLTHAKLVGGELINDIGITSVLAELNWQTRIQADNLQLDFRRGKNQYTLEVATLDKIVDKLELVNDLNVNTIALLADNPIKNVQVDLSDAMNIDFSKQKSTGGTIRLSSQNEAAPINILFNDLAFSYQINPTFSIALDSAELSFNSLLNIQQVLSITDDPIKVNLTANIKQTSKQWLLTLHDDSFVSLQNLAIDFDEGRNHSYQNATFNPSMASLQFAVNGDVAIDKHNLQSNLFNNAKVALSLSSSAKQLDIAKFLFLNELTVDAKLSGNRDGISMLAKVSTDQLPIASVELSGDLKAPVFALKGNDILLTDLLALHIQLPLEVNLIDGRLSYHLHGQIFNINDITANTFDASLTLKNVSGDIGGTWLQELNWQQEVRIKNNHIKSIVQYPVLEGEVLPNFSLAKIESVTPITNVVSDIVFDTSIANFTVTADDISGNILGGSFELNQVQWPLNQIKPIEVNLTKIDLEKLLALDKKQGIVVTGSVSGHLPVYFDGIRPLIKEGHLYNVGSGVIQVFNNPAVEELKSGNTQLKLAFDALQNLHYHHLSSEASMADDGYMLLLTTIKGQNPDLQNDVNFNLNLTYDLLGLLESLTITKQLENQVINDLQN